MTEAMRRRLADNPQSGGLKFAVLLLLAAGLLVSAGCVPAPQPPRPVLDEQALARRLQANADAVRSMRCMARLRTENAAGSASTRQVLLLEKPDRIRAEVLSPFGQPLLLLTVRDGQLRVWLPREERFLAGPATAGSIARLVSMPLTAEQLVRLALYDLPLIRYRESVLRRTETGYRWQLSAGDDRQELDFDPLGRLLGAVYYRSEVPVLQVAYENFAASGIGFPRRVRVDMPEQKAAFSMSYDDLELNFEPQAQSFVLQPPPGAVMEALP